jgi:predicted nucleotidyltransferase
MSIRCPPWDRGVPCGILDFVEDREIASRIRARIQANPGTVIAAYLHGSAARGGMRPDSDVDVAVLLREPLPLGAEALCQPLASALEKDLGQPVDLTVLNLAPPDLVHRVLRDEALIVELDRSARIRFEVRTRNEYFDVRPRLDEYRQLSPSVRDRR